MERSVTSSHVNARGGPEIPKLCSDRRSKSFKEAAGLEDTASVLQEGDVENCAGLADNVCIRKRVEKYTSAIHNLLKFRIMEKPLLT